MFDEAGKQKVRAQFRRLGWIMRILAALGRSARMSSAEAAEVAIEMDAVNGVLGPDFVALECPTVFVVGTEAYSGATEDAMRTVRAAVTDAVESNKRVSVFATTPHKHTQILNKAPDTVVAAIENVIQESSWLTFDRLTHRPARDGGLYGWGVIRPRGTSRSADLPNREASRGAPRDAFGKRRAPALGCAALASATTWFRRAKSTADLAEATSPSSPLGARSIGFRFPTRRGPEGDARRGCSPAPAPKKCHSDPLSRSAAVPSMTVAVVPCTP